MELAIVTGSSRGIGKAIALELASSGINVVITCRSRIDEAIEVSEMCKAKGVSSMAISFDVSNFDECKMAYSKIQEQMGNPTILINNAGAMENQLFARTKPENFNYMINANLNSVFNMSNICVPSMMKARSGRIINLTSVVGLYGNLGQVSYSSSKAGILGFTKSLSRELSTRGITVNAVAPGFIDTDMTSTLPDETKKAILERISSKRFGKAEDIANAVAFLASDKSNYITGQVIEVSGGLSL